MSYLKILICAGLVSGAANAASAATLDFELSFFGDIEANGTSLTVDEVTISGSGDTDNVVFSGVSRYSLALDTVSIEYQGNTYGFLEPISLVRSGGSLGLTADGGSSFFSMSPGLVMFPSLGSFNLASDFSFDFIDGVQCCNMGGSFSTTVGTLTSFAGQNAPGAFSATVTDTPSEVPLPASGLLLLAGLGGLMMRRKRT